MVNFKSLWIGLAAGLFGGLAGLGGGVVAVPLMTSFLGISQHVATATSLVMVIFTAISGAITYGLHGKVDWVASVVLASTAIIAARLGAQFSHSLPEWKLKRFFGWYLLVISVLLLFKPLIPHVSSRPEGLLYVLPLLFAGGLAGFFSGMLGVGGGTVMVPIMVLLAGLEQHVAQGSSLMAMIPSAAVGSYTHYRLGKVFQQALPGLIAGVLLGTAVGGNIANVLPEWALRTVFAVVLVWTAMRYVAARPKSTPQEQGSRIT
ncbi:MAG: sulfite exporter TauE/SafE family protein [Thermaceae bacterium]|nr:sulfite exporter TauE/SafE family protein [Thermaceae bacterium]